MCGVLGAWIQSLKPLPGTSPQGRAACRPGSCTLFLVREQVLSHTDEGQEGKQLGPLRQEIWGGASSLGLPLPGRQMVSSEPVSKPFQAPKEQTRQHGSEGRGGNSFMGGRVIVLAFHGLRESPEPRELSRPPLTPIPPGPALETQGWWG